MLTLKLKAAMVGSRLDGLAHRIKRWSQFSLRQRHPELAELFLEEDRLPLVLARLLKPDSNVADVGCHIGSFLTLASRIAPAGRHVAIEASPSKAAWLYAKFPKATVHAVAVGRSNGSAMFYEDRNRPGFSRIGHEISGADRLEVKVRTLDDLLSSHSRIDLIKLDIEGGELDALKGATDVLGRFRPAVLFECAATVDLEKIGISRSEIFYFFEAGGYAVHTFGDFLFDKGPMVYDEFRKCGLYPFRAFNFIALPLSQ